MNWTTSPTGISTGRNAGNDYGTIWPYSILKLCWATKGFHVEILSSAAVECLLTDSQSTVLNKKGKVVSYSINEHWARSWSWSLGSQPAVHLVTNPEVGCDYLPWLSSQMKSITAPWPVPNYTAQWQRDTGVSSLPKATIAMVLSQDSDPRPVSRKSDALPTAPLCRVNYWMQNNGYTVLHMLSLQLFVTRKSHQYMAFKIVKWNAF